MPRPGLHDYFMGIANAVALRSTCTRHRIGAVIVDSAGRILSTGYNGAPRGLAHCLDLGCMRDLRNIKSGTDHQYCRSVHAEQNSLAQAGDRDKLFGATLYCNYSPCVICAKMIINSGITKIVYTKEYPDALAKEMLMEAGVALIEWKI